MPTSALRRGFPPRGLFLARTPIARFFSAGPADKEPPTRPVTDAILAKLSAKKLHRLTLADFVSYGHPPLSQPSLFRAANFALSVLPARFAHRIQAIRNLPYIVVTNPNVSEIHDNYIHSLSTLLPFADRTIETDEDEEAFTEAMLGLVQRHTNTIPIIARGFLESRKYISAAAVKRFLDAHLSARIGTRLIAEQHIALHYSSERHSHPSHSSSHDDTDPPSSYIGIIDTAVRPAAILQNCESFVAEICELRYGVRPSLRIDGDSSARIAHVPVHLEYILTELLKNAFRAVVERGTERHPVLVTIAPTKPSKGEVSDGLTIRIRDRGGGIPPENVANLWTYGFTTFSEHDAATTAGSGMDALNVISGGGGGAGGGGNGGGSSLAGLGYGLPLGRAYAEFFGGSIAVQSLWGWGTDVYLGLRGVPKMAEVIREHDNSG